MLLDLIYLTFLKNVYIGDTSEILSISTLYLKRFTLRRAP